MILYVLQKILSAVAFCSCTIFFMRKKVCSGCGKIIFEDEICSCRDTAFKPKAKKSRPEQDVLHTRKWRKKREAIIKRDGYMCMRCLIKYKFITTENLTAHHIKSRKNYPELTFDDNNLVCVCDTCNKQMGTKDVLDFEWNIEEKNDNREFVL